MRTETTDTVASHGVGSSSAAAVRARRLAPWLLAILALVPALSMLALVRGGNLMQWNDYWDILPRVTNPDGSFAPRGLFEYQNEHPVAVPSFIYWLNAHVTGGSNVALGTFVVAVVGGQVALLTWALPRQIASVPIRRAAFAVVFAALLFAPRGVHNFLLAMSGTAWLTANLFAVVAIFVAWRRQPLLAVPVAALASISYGTGLTTFPVLILLALLERKSRRIVAIMVATTLGAAALYMVGYAQPDIAPGTDRTPMEILRRTCQVLGGPFSDSTDVAGTLGAVLLCLAGFALWWVWQQRLYSQLAPWIGLLAYALGGAVLIAFARGGVNDDVGISSRYVSLGALAWLATLVLVAAARPQRPLVLAGLAAVSVAAFVGGQQTVTSVRAGDFYSDNLAIALRLGVVPGPTDRLFNAAAVPVMRKLAHYPFNGDFDLDCGFLGERIEASELGAASSRGSTGVTGSLDRYVPSAYDTAVQVTGWAASDAGRIRCILLVDDEGRVVGAASYGTERPDLERAGYLRAQGFIGVALTLPPGSSLRAVVVARDELVVLDGRLTSEGRVDGNES